MDARLSHVLVALVAVGVTVAGYTIVDGVASTVKGLAGDGRPVRVARVDEPSKEPGPEAKAEGKGDGKADHKADHKGDKGDKRDGRDAGEAKEPKGGNGPLVARAEELGVDPKDLREQRAAEMGVTLDQYKRRKQERSEWRAKQDPDELVARRDLRQERKAAAELTPEQAAEREQLRQMRQDVGDLDPSLRDAAGVLKQLRELGQAEEEDP